MRCLALTPLFYAATVALRLAPSPWIRHCRVASACHAMQARSLSLDATHGKICEILKMGDPRLLRTAEKVEPSQIGSEMLNDLVADLHQTMRAANGAGISAPQIGVNLQVVVFGSTSRNPRYPDRPLVPPTVLVNPEITPLGDELEDDWEGCLSVPGMRGLVPRWRQIRYTGLDQFGAVIDRTVEGFHARVVQHECDHLWGKLYPMRMVDMSKFGFAEVLFPSLPPNEDD